MKTILTITTAFLLLLLAAPPAFAQGASDDWSIAEWDALIREATELYQAGQYGRAVVVAKEALELAEENVDPNHFAVAESVNNLAVLYHKQGQYAQAEPLYQRALAIREKALGPDHPAVAHSLNNLA